MAVDLGKRIGPRIAKQGPQKAQPIAHGRKPLGAESLGAERGRQQGELRAMGFEELGNERLGYVESEEGRGGVLIFQRSEEISSSSKVRAAAVFISLI